MQRFFWVLAASLWVITACSKKAAEIEMQLPTPTPRSTPMITASPTVAPSPSPESQVELHYLIEDIQGTVLILSDDASVPESAAIGETVEPGDELITKDGSEAILALNDNTMVHVSADTQVKVADLSPNDSDGFKSKLQLLIGSILSEVEKLDQSRSSFEIEAGGVVCAVRGTAFEVQKQGTNISTSTFHGVVEMQKDGHIQKVLANQHSTYSLKASSFLKQRRLNVTERKHYQAWTKKMKAVLAKRSARISNPGPSKGKNAKKIGRKPQKKRTLHQRRPPLRRETLHHMTQRPRPNLSGKKSVKVRPRNVAPKPMRKIRPSQRRQSVRPDLRRQVPRPQIKKRKPFRKKQEDP